MPPMVDEANARRRYRRDWDAYGVVIASFIGLVAVLVSGYTAFLQNRQVRAQVWPRVELHRDGSKGSLVAVNSGVGPARVKAMRVSVDGRAVKRWMDLLSAIGHQGGFVQTQTSGRVLPPGTQVDMLLMGHQGEAGRKTIQDIADYLWEEKAKHRIGILICYCSVLGDCWLAGTGQLGGINIDEDEQIGDCPIADSDKFRQ